MPVSLNLDVAARLEEVADLLRDQGANPFRVEAYRRAAATVRRFERSVADLLRTEGPDGLQNLAGIGESLARAIEVLVTTGRLPMLERLRGESDPVTVLASVPGIGEVLAERLYHDLGIGSLEGLEAAACNGRLARLAGFGSKRIAGIRDTLATRLGRVRPTAPGGAAPPVDELLDVDAEYRAKAAEGKLRRIAPRRFNAEGKAWLPVLHTSRRERQYTALFSNTARAHQLGRTHDWVILYQDGGREERQFTVVTARGGMLRGKRIVRGREEDCARHYGVRMSFETAEPEAAVRR